MSERKSQKIEEIEKKALGESQKLSVHELSPIHPESKVYLHYPNPVALNYLLEKVALWSGFQFTMNPKLNQEIQIIAPYRISQKEAFVLFLSSLQEIGLRAVHIEAMIVKIVPLYENEKSI